MTNGSAQLKEIIMTFAKYPPENISEAITVFKQDVEITHEIVHGDGNTEVLTENGLVPSFSRVINTFEVQGQQVISEFGWTQVGTFAAGFTFTSPNQVGQDVDGNWWRWNGALPKTVTAGTLPSSDSNYKLVGDGVLRSDLANGTAIVQDLPISDFGLRSAIRASLYGLWQLDGTKTVITGDSLSFNFYGYASGYRAEPWDCPHGMRSWSFLLRDAIHMCDKDFVYGDSVLGVVTAGAATISHALPNFTLGFNNRFSLIDVTSADAVYEFMCSGTNLLNNKKIVLHLARIPGFEGRFDIYTDNGAGEVYATSVDLVTAVDYLGYEPLIIDVPYSVSGSFPDRPAKIIIKNFLASGGGPFPSQVKFALMCVGSKNSPVYLTGHGGYTAQMIANEFEDRIGRYDADVLIVIVGANDRTLLTPAQYEAGYRSIITQALGDNPKMRIVLMGAMPATDVGYRFESDVLNGYQLSDYLIVPARLAKEFNCTYIDNYRAMYPRYEDNLFDNVHLNFNGNTGLFGVSLGELMPNAPATIAQLNGISTYGFDSSGALLGRQAINNDKTPAQNFFETFVTASCSGGAWTINSDQDSRAIVDSSSIPSDGRLTLVTNYHLRTGTVIPTALDVSIEQFGSATDLFFGRVFAMTPNTVTFVFGKTDGSLATTTDLNDNNFRIRFGS